MSYCRWSSDDFRCDVYCYEDIYLGYTIHVAGRRIVFDGTEPNPVELRKDNIEEFAKYQEDFSNWIGTAQRIDIGLPHDGESFSFYDPEETANKLEELRNIGYMVPQYAIDALREESDELNTK